MLDEIIVLCTLAPKSHRTAEENLGLAYLASSLRKNNYKVKIIDGWLLGLDFKDVKNKLLKLIEEKKVIFIGISSYQLNINDSLELAKELKTITKTPLLAGGFGPTFSPKRFLENGFDYVCRGEGEEALVDVAYCLKNGIRPIKVQNISYFKDKILINNSMRPLKSNLDELPFPARDTMLNAIKKNSCVNILSSRGCNGSCMFCSVVSFFRLTNGKAWRSRTITNIIDELLELKKYNVKYVKFIDDSFLENDRDDLWCKKFADSIVENNIKMSFRASVKAEKVTDMGMKELKRAGFYSFSCGIENGSETALKRMNKGANLKENKKALEIFKKYNFFVQAGFILFDDCTTFEELTENYEFLSNYSWIITKGIFTEMYAAEGTPFTNKMMEDGKIHNKNRKNDNNEYSIDNYDAYLVYVGLKTWHKEHMYLYDKTIEPISAPKGVSIDILEKFYKCYLSIKEEDLFFFKMLLNEIVEKKCNTFEDVLLLCNQRIVNTSSKFKGIREEVEKIYIKYGLIYDGCKNPYIE